MTGVVIQGNQFEQNAEIHIHADSSEEDPAGLWERIKSGAEKCLKILFSYLD